MKTTILKSVFFLVTAACLLLPQTGFAITSSTVLFEDGFEADLSAWDNTNWELTSQQVYSGAGSVRISAPSGDSAPLTMAEGVDTRGADEIVVRFRLRQNYTDSGSDIFMKIYADGELVYTADLYNSDQLEWIAYEYTFYPDSDADMFVEDFKVEFEATNLTYNGWFYTYPERVYLDDFTIMYNSNAVVDPADKASNPGPADGAANVDINKDLSWTPAANAESQKIYMGDAPEALVLVGEQTEGVIDPGTMLYMEWHYWRVDTIVGATTYYGDVWSFYIPDALEEDTATPLDGATYIYKNADLEWPAVTGADSYNVYFGDDPENLEFKGNQTGTSYDPGEMDYGVKADGTKDSGKWYYWRIDVVDGGAVQVGAVWSFFVPGLMTYPDDGLPVGGGVGYITLGGDLDYSNNYTYKVECEDTESESFDCRDELLSRLAVAQPGEIVYIPGDTEINMTGSSLIVIPDGVKLVGDRGKPNDIPGEEPYKGALIHKDGHMDSAALFLVEGAGVHITGLRFKGPQTYWTDFVPEVTGESGSRGIRTLSDTQIYNCEFYNWSYTAIDIQDAAGIQQQIHHNYIHDCHGPLGYGIEMGEGYPQITANIFDRCRHHIAGIGQEDCSYDAGYNIVLEGIRNYDKTGSHNFDMHRNKPYFIAGTTIDIHHNTFSHYFSDGTATTSSVNGKNIGIRGRPDDSCDIYCNWFFDDNISHAVRQSNSTGNMYVYDNFVSMDQLAQDVWDVDFW